MTFWFCHPTDVLTYVFTIMFYRQLVLSTLWQIILFKNTNTYVCVIHNQSAEVLSGQECASARRSLHRTALTLLLLRTPKVPAVCSHTTSLNIHTTKTRSRCNCVVDTAVNVVYFQLQVGIVIAIIKLLITLFTRNKYTTCTTEHVLYRTIIW